MSLNLRANEIHENAQFWHNKAEHNLYRFFLEIKKIRDERLFSELGFSDFDEYCQSAWNLKRRVVDERIQIANSFSEEDFKRYSARLGHKKTLLLTTMNEEQRDQSLNEGVPTERGYKPYDKATQKEIAEYKRNSEEMERKAKEYEKQLKQRDEEKKQLENQLKNSTRSEGILQDKLEQLENKPPKVIERFLEPEDYQQIKTSLEQKESYINELQTEVANMRNERNEMDKKSREYDRLNEAINEMNGRLNEGQMRIKNQKAVYDLIRKSEELVKEVAPLVYALDHLDVEDNEYAKKPIIQLIKNIDDISQKLKKQLSERQIIEVN